MDTQVGVTTTRLEKIKCAGTKRVIRTALHAIFESFIATRITCDHFGRRRPAWPLLLRTDEKTARLIKTWATHTYGVPHGLITTNGKVQAERIRIHVDFIGRHYPSQCHQSWRQRISWNDWRFGRRYFCLLRKCRVCSKRGDSSTGGNKMTSCQHKVVPPKNLALFFSNSRIRLEIQIKKK